jgi:hypothetical protein
MAIIPTYLRILVCLYGALIILGAINTWSSGYDFPVAAFSALGVLLIVAASTNRKSWILPLLIIGLSDEVAALFLPIADSTTFAGRLFGVAIVTALFITWIRFERTAIAHNGENAV